MCFSVVVKFFWLATLLWGGAFFTQVSCFNFNFPSFQDGNNLLLSNNSNVFLGDAVQLTPDVGSRPIANISGRAFYRKPFRLWKKRGFNAVFNSTFTLRIRNQTATAGEGLAFVLTDNTEIPENSDGQWLSIAPRKFKLRKLIKATDKFNPKNQLGRGGFRTVYKGTWKNKLIAVKRVSETSRQGKQAFITEVTTIGSLRHRNLEKLIGWCYKNNDFLLVYEYMPNGSLDKFIFYNEKSSTGQSTLDWDTRVSIIHGTALALDYLHNGCEKRVLHRDIKSSNIMLDSEFKARLRDFGLARTIQES
ncbi:hypothetical protein Dsin_007072 [Dipteronia sinensis]|uniref:non-specific serine/threonine protein kinase n=1 Tax=Dipteronia sinensis TaxID=43782 RepID=A0AAE0B0H7_9ROSI|nr:hypothetical protein Dsin_007072 [Dipteronia sinensis]